MATVRASHAAIPFMEKAGGGAILNISSISGYRASARTAPYAAVKAARHQLHHVAGADAGSEEDPRECDRAGLD